MVGEATERSESRRIETVVGETGGAIDQFEARSSERTWSGDSRDDSEELDTVAKSLSMLSVVMVVVVVVAEVLEGGSIRR